MKIIPLASDTFRRDYLGSYGNDWIHTPHIDKVARESVNFDNASKGSFPTVFYHAGVVTESFSFPAHTQSYSCYGFGIGKKISTDARNSCIHSNNKRNLRRLL